MKQCTIILLLLTTLCTHTYAQKKQGQSMDLSALKKKMQKACADKIGESFSPVEEWKCIDGTYFDLNKTTTPTIIFLGFDGCAPCHAALPVYAKISGESSYKGYNFVYLTFDDSATIGDETRKLNTANIKMAHLDNNYMHRSKMVESYPTVYFINANKTVKSIWAYGAENGDLTSSDYWHLLIDKLK